jgi:multidrug resistance efflux pump
VKTGQRVEVTFKFLPGAIHTGKVETVFQAISSGQTQVSGSAVAPTTLHAAPFVVRVKLDNDTLAKSLPAGSVGDAAIFTDHIKATHIIRRVLLRQIAILNYINPF